MKYIIVGKFNTGERWTETADNKRELAAVLEKIESNPTCGAYEVRKAMYIVDDWSENRGTHERYATKAEAMQHATAADALKEGVKSGAYITKGGTAA